AEKRTKKGAGGSGPPGPLNGQGQAPGPQKPWLTEGIAVCRKNIHTVLCLPQEGMFISMNVLVPERSYFRVTQTSP
ncbi:MAG: hypothetical protein FWH55_13095, partial [Oscillospiraceae bacterium]|nr:hypothetical protein [Oscillospiraceae bacterium]